MAEMQVTALGKTARRVVKVNGNRADIRKIVESSFDEEVVAVSVEADQYDSRLIVRATNIGFFRIDVDLDPRSVSLVCLTPDPEEDDRAR